MVRGRDIQRYKANWAKLWLLDTHNGYGDVPAIDIDDYPVVKEHLDRYYVRLAKRYDKGRTPYNLRNCAYHEDFTKEKLLWMDMSPTGRFAYSDTEVYCNNKGFMMTGGPLKYLCAILNSALVTWLMRHTARTTGVGLTQWEKFTVERLPIPKIGPDGQAPLIQLTDRILCEVEGGLRDTAALEEEIDRLVYELYELTDSEIRAIVGQ